jgi:hypothetical protein
MRRSLVGMGPSPGWAGEHAMPVFGTHRVSADARHAGLWIPGSADRRGMPFAIVDRNDARIYVFEASGRLSSASSALLGQARGDHSAPGVGERTQAGAVPPHERTTPSCRFMSEPDAISMASRSYGSTTPSPWPFTAFARVRARLAREARLSSGTPRDDRVSLGCLVGPEPFYTKWFSRSWDARAPSCTCCRKIGWCARRSTLSKSANSAQSGCRGAHALRAVTCAVLGAGIVLQQYMARADASISTSL